MFNYKFTKGYKDIGACMLNKGHSYKIDSEGIFSIESPIESFMIYLLTSQLIIYTRDIGHH